MLSRSVGWLGLSVTPRWVEGRADGVVYDYRRREDGKFTDIFAVRGGFLGEKQAAMTEECLYNK